MSFETFDIEVLYERSGQLKPYILAWTSESRTQVRIIKSGLDIVDCIGVEFKSSSVYYAHNLRFDLSLFFNSLLAKHIPYDWLFIDDILYYIKIHFIGGTITLRCSLQLLPMPLNQLGHILGMNKLYFPYEVLYVGLWNPDEIVHGQEKVSKDYWDMTYLDYLIYYAKSDIIILYNALLKLHFLLASLGLKNLIKYNSLSSISLDLCLSMVNRQNLYLGKSNSAPIRKAYFGGRCEVFGNLRPDESLYHFDFRGMYSLCMQEYLPIGPWRFALSPLDFREPGYYSITYRSCMDIPVLPSRRNDKLLFENGYKSGLFWFEEIILFVEAGGEVIKLHYGLLCTDYQPFLKAFSVKLDLKRYESGFSNKVCKLIANALYGRLGMDSTMNFMELCPPSYYNSGCLHSSWGGLRLIKKPKSVSGLVNVALAAAITSKARIKLYNSFITVSSAGGRLLYCDTDSIFVAFPKEKQVLDRSFGSITFKSNDPEAQFADGVFALPKTYALKYTDGKEVIKIKGISRADISFEAFSNSFSSDDTHSLVFRSPILLKDGLHFVREHVERVVNLHGYTKRIWSGDKKSTLPITFNDDYLWW